MGYTTKKMKNKNHMIILIDAEKCSITPAAIYDKSSQRSGTTSIPLKIGNNRGMSAFTSLIQHSTGSPNHSSQTRRRNKRHLNWKGRNKAVFICR